MTPKIHLHFLWSLARLVRRPNTKATHLIAAMRLASKVEASSLTSLIAFQPVANALTKQRMRHPRVQKQYFEGVLICGEVSPMAQ